jgi:hypothetical protein
MARVQAGAVVTLGKPDPIPLLAARHVVVKSPELQRLFTRSREENWTSEKLAFEMEEPLQSRLSCDISQVVEVARYLADEYQQLGDKMLLIDRETGKAIARVTDDDLWQPPMVPRESGGLAKPLLRLKPEIEARLILWHHDAAREERLISEITPRLHQTEALRREGDRRLLVITRKGRSNLVVELRERVPDLLTKEAKSGGSLGSFLRHFEIRDGDPPADPFVPLGPYTDVARVVKGVQDPKTLNFSYDVLGSLITGVVGQWGRQIAYHLAEGAAKRFDLVIQHYTTMGDTSDIQSWVANPNTTRVLSKRPRVLPTLTVESCPRTLGLKGAVGAIVVDSKAYACLGREIFDRWEVNASFSYTLWVDWTQVRAFDLDAVPASGVSILPASGR